MQTNTVLKLGITALLSVTIAACSSNDTDGSAGSETVSTTPPATSAPVNNSQPTAAELEQQRLMATKIFYFEFDRSDLSAEARTALVAHANYLKANPGQRYRLEGHADERGSREYNLALGERRARSTLEILRTEGVAEEQVQVHSYGEENPLSLGRDELSWQQNRRVELIYIR